MRRRRTTAGGALVWLMLPLGALALGFAALVARQALTGGYSSAPMTPEQVQADSREREQRSARDAYRLCRKEMDRTASAITREGIAQACDLMRSQYVQQYGREP